MGTFIFDRFSGRNAHMFQVHEGIMTIPNMVTFTGIIWSFLYLIMYLFGICTYLIPVLVIFIVLTDGIDGYLADRLNQHSKYGKFLDPLRDRLFTLALLGNIWLIVGNQALPAIILLIVIESNLALHYREVYLSTGKIKEVHWIGKARSALQWILGFGILIQFYWLGVVYVAPLSLVYVMFLASLAVHFNTYYRR